MIFWLPTWIYAVLVREFFSTSEADFGDSKRKSLEMFLEEENRNSVFLNEKVQEK